MANGHLADPVPEEPYRQPTQTISRRAFLQGLGAGVLITVFEGPSLGQVRRGRGRGGDLTIAARIHVAADGSISVMTGKIEEGQGARTELTQAAAEELGVSVDRVRLVMADTDLTPNDGITAGSRTTPGTVPAVRQGAAAVRDLLLAMAARQWGVDRADVELRDGKAVHAATKRELSYADLAANDQESKALQQTIPANIKVTPLKDWRILGTTVLRPNARDIVTGAHGYPSNTTRPGMLCGKALRPPSYGARLTKLDTEGARGIPGAVVVHEDQFVGVAAPTMHAAARAIAALEKAATWEPADRPSSGEVYDYLRKHARGGAPKNPFADELAAASKALRQTYHTAYVQHSPLEPRAALAEWNAGKLTVWTGCSNPFGAKSEIARAVGIAADRVRVIVPDFGGGFGGKHTADAGVEAALIARGVGKPVLVRWTRAEELTWAYFRPAAVIDIEAGLDAKGIITSWFYVNINSGGAAIETPYRIAKARSQYVRSDSPLRQGSYRALAATANNFARESFMDELAHAAGADPLTFRLAHLDNARLRAVLETAATRFDWTKRARRKSPKVGVGLACGTEKGSFVAACVEVGIEDGRIVVRRVCEVFECGAILNPANLLSQVQGCIMMGLGPALREEILFDRGAVTNATFSEYLVPRFSDLPELDVHLLNRTDLPSVGGGETPIMAIAPAIANAVFHATGRRIRQMPIRLPEDEKP